MNQTILITGATDGIGKLVAEKLAHDNFEIILHGRNGDKLKAVIEQIQEHTGNQKIHAYLSDFADLNSVKTMAEKLNQDFSNIDIIINNAGIFKAQVDKSQDGYDIRFAVNYLAPYYLTQLVLPSLNNSESPKLINLSSAAQSPVDLSALSDKHTMSAQSAYAQSKLALTMWSFHLATHQPELAVIAVNPGSLLNTKMVQEAYGQYWSSADKGAQILYDLAILENALSVSGQYYDNDKGQFGPAHPDAYDSEKTQALIDCTEKILDSYK